MTNGAVRDLPTLKALVFHLFSGSVAVSHAYAHIFDFGEPVEIGGLKIEPGDLIQGDRHGVQSIPLRCVPEIPREAEKIQRAESQLIQYCRSQQFSLKGLSDRLKLGLEDGP